MICTKKNQEAFKNVLIKSVIKVLMGSLVAPPIKIGLSSEVFLQWLLLYFSSLDIFGSTTSNLVSHLNIVCACAHALKPISEKL